MTGEHCLTDDDDDPVSDLNPQDLLIGPKSNIFPASMPVRFASGLTAPPFNRQEEQRLLMKSVEGHAEKGAYELARNSTDVIVMPDLIRHPESPLQPDWIPGYAGMTA